MKIIDVENVRQYLIDKQYIKSDTIAIKSLGKRNSVFLIEQQRKTFCIVKQIADGSDLGNYYFEREYFIGNYNWEGYQHLPNFILKNIYADSENRVFINEYFDSFSLAECLSNKDISVLKSIGNQLALCLGELHSKKTPNNLPKEIALGKPLFYDLLNTEEGETESLPSLLRFFLRHIQKNDSFCRVIRDTMQNWQSDNLIHGDLNSNNILLGKSGAIKLIDWELCQIADPLWDIALLIYHLELEGTDSSQTFLTEFWAKYTNSFCWDNEQILEKEKILNVYCSLNGLQRYYEFLRDKIIENPNYDPPGSIFHSRINQEINRIF
jgi:thiamine kinase-like enzyme